ncbi:MAG: hypothetical protein HYX92_14805 [Chloroflexi bacterium]|nr:hypothetical protein [Chloroflexota bacterium]
MLQRAGCVVRRPCRQACIAMAGVSAAILTAWFGNVEAVKMTLARAQAVLATHPTNISQTGLKSWAPAVAADPTGNVHVVWVEETPGNSEIMHRRWNGAAWDEPENLSRTGGASQSPSVAADTVGNAHLVWQDKTSGRSEILYRRWDGNAWSPATRVSLSTGQAISPAVTTDSFGLVHVVWSDDATGNYQVLYRKGDGNSWMQAETLSRALGDSLGAAIAAAGPQREVHVAWYENSSGNWEVIYRRWSAAGGGDSWSPAQNLSQNNGASVSPTLAADSSGRVHILWQDNTYGNNEVLYRRWDGSGWSLAENLSRNGGDSGAPRAIVDSSDGLHVLWHDGTTGNYEVLHRRWDGAAWSSVENLSENAGDSRTPSVAVGAQSLHLVWDDNTPGNSDILYARLTSGVPPTPTGTPTATPVSPGTPVPTATPAGRAIQLLEGWNLISFPGTLEDTSIGSVFAQNPTVARAFTSQDGAWAYARRNAEGWTGSLSQVMDGVGYYVHSSGPATLPLRLKPGLLTTSGYDLPSGWSLIGYSSSLQKTPVGTYLGSLRGQWTSLFRYDATEGWALARPDGAGFQELEFGRGYWIHLSTAGRLVPPRQVVATPSPVPTPDPRPPTPAQGASILPNVTVRPGRPPTTAGQDVFAAPPDDCPAVRSAPALQLRSASEIDGVADLDVIYIERTPKYRYQGPKTFPDPGEQVTFTAHVANKGGVSTGVSSPAMSIRWQVIDPGGRVIADLASSPGVVIRPAEIAAFQLGWAWVDGPYQVRFVVNEDGRIREGAFTNNNDLAVYANALTVGFAINASLYDWMNSAMSGELDVGRFYWFTRPASSGPFRARTYSLEDWAQRQVAQLNEYFAGSEIEHMDGAANSLPRVALQQIEIIPDADNLSSNSPLPQKGDWATLDLVWGFPARLPKDQVPGGCYLAGDQGASAWYRYYHPGARNVEYSLIHELGHHLGLWHEEDAVGAFSFTPLTSHITLLDGSLAIPNKQFMGDRSEMDSIMANSGYGRAFSRYASRTLAYRFQSLPGRGVPARIGPMSGSWGGAVPTGQGAYWDRYPPSSPWSWPFFETPKTVDIRLTDRMGRPVSGAQADFYVAERPPAALAFPSGLSVPFSVRWTGKFTPSRSGTYRFVTYSLGNARLYLGGRELINPDGAKPVYLAEGKRAYERGREFRHGLLDTDAIALRAGVAYPFFIEYNSFDVYGGKRFGLFYKGEGFDPPFGLSQIRPGELKTEEDQPGGLTARFWNGGSFGQDGSLAETRVSSRPEASEANTLVFGSAPKAQGISDSGGIVRLDPMPFLSNLGSRPSAGASPTMMVVVVTQGSTQSIRVVPLADLNYAYWSGSRDAATISLSLTLDGGRSPLG